MSRWIPEKLHDSFGIGLKVDRLVVETRTQHQELLIFENAMFGRVLMLDGVIQLTTRDEFIYHEMMAHVPLFALPDPRDILIIGGGDGGLMREVLRHRSVKKAVICELDRQVIDLCREYFQQVSKGAFDDPRVQIVIRDGMEYVSETDEQYDAILVDSTDPIGNGEVLFSREFYSKCRRCLKPGGILVTQNGVPFVQGEELTQSIRYFRELFDDASCYLATVPTYIGGPMAFGWATDDTSLRKISLGILEKRFDHSGFRTNYYTPDVHDASFSKPQYIYDLMK